MGKGTVPAADRPRPRRRSGCGPRGPPRPVPDVPFCSGLPKIGPNIDRHCSWFPRPCCSPRFTQKNPDIQTAPAFCIQVAKRGRRAQQTKVTGAGARTLCKLCSCFVLPYFGISPWRLTFLSDFIFSKQKARLTGRRAQNMDGVFA